MRSSSLRAAPGAPWRVLQVATHGYVDREQPSLAFLAFTPSAGSDGLLTVQEVLGRPCPAETVILSACHVGRGEIVRGEGIMGLARAFLVAGARQVVVASWAVDDAHATRLMAALHERLKVEPDAAEALTQARLTSPPPSSVAPKPPSRSGAGVGARRYGGRP